MSKFLNVLLVILEVLARNSEQINHSDNAEFKHKGEKVKSKEHQREFGFRVAGSNFLANTVFADQRNSRCE